MTAETKPDMRDFVVRNKAGRIIRTLSVFAPDNWLDIMRTEAKADSFTVERMTPDEIRAEFLRDKQAALDLEL